MSSRLIRIWSISVLVVVVTLVGLLINWVSLQVCRKFLYLSLIDLFWPWRSMSKSPRMIMSHTPWSYKSINLLSRSARHASIDPDGGRYMLPMKVGLVLGKSSFTQVHSTSVQQRFHSIWGTKLLFLVKYVSIPPPPLWPVPLSRSKRWKLIPVPCHQ